VIGSGSYRLGEACKKIGEACKNFYRLCKLCICILRSATGFLGAVDWPEQTSNVRLDHFFFRRKFPLNKKLCRSCRDPKKVKGKEETWKEHKKNSHNEKKKKMSASKSLILKEADKSQKKKNLGAGVGAGFFLCVVAFAVSWEVFAGG